MGNGLTIGLVVPVYVNFQGFAELMASVNQSVIPIVIPNWRENAGVSKGWNRGIHRAMTKRCDICFVINDDVVLETLTMGQMIHGILDGHDLVTGYNTRDERHDGLGDKYLDTPDYSCFAIRPLPFIAKFGGFDENFSPAYFEDNDMAYRMKLSGGSGVKMLTAPFYHKGSVTQNWEGGLVVTHEMFRKNRAYYEQKWGGPPGEERFTNPFNDPNKTLKDW